MHKCTYIKNCKLRITNFSGKAASGVLLSSPQAESSVLGNRTTGKWRKSECPKVNDLLLIELSFPQSVFLASQDRMQK